MERETNQTQQPSQCRMGCGFYGNSSFDGMCSKCYRDHVRRKQSSSPVGASCFSTGSPTVVTTTSSPYSITATNVTIPHASVTTQPAVVPPVFSIAVDAKSDELDVSCSSSSSSSDDSSSCTTHTSSAAGLGAASPESTDGAQMSRRNRCLVCKKKLGLTGFTCRCEGLFCGVHRYSDTHSCAFDYKTAAREKLVKENPVVVSDKVNKI